MRAAAPPPPRWPKVAVWHGDADATVTPAAAEALARQWCDVHAATRSAALPRASERDTHTAWSGPDGSVVVALHRIAGLGHGAPIAANGVDGCGTPAPWILEAGLSSTREIARSWDLLKDERRAAAPESSPAAKAPDGAAARVRRTTVATGGSDFSPRAADDEDVHNVHGLRGRGELRHARRPSRVSVGSTSRLDRRQQADSAYYFPLGGAAGSPLVLGCEALGLSGPGFFDLPLDSFIYTFLWTNGAPYWMRGVL